MLCVNAIYMKFFKTRTACYFCHVQENQGRYVAVINQLFLANYTKIVLANSSLPDGWDERWTGLEGKGGSLDSQINGVHFSSGTGKIQRNDTCV